MVQANLVHLRRVRERTLALLENLSAEQLDYVPEPGEWSVSEVADHLILSERLLQKDISILIDRAKAGQEPYLYRSFAEFNARPACFPEAMLPFLEPVLNVVTLFVPAAMREYIVRNVPFRALAPDASLPQKGKAKDVLCDELRTNLQATEDLFAANSSVDYDKMRHQHPLFGIQTVPQLLRTLWLHEQAHQDQLSSIMASPRFP